MRAPRVLFRATPLMALGAVVAASAWGIAVSRAGPDRAGSTRASVVLAFPVEGGLLFADIRSQGQRRTELPQGYLVVPSPDARLVAYAGSPSSGIEIRDARNGRRLGHFAIPSGGPLVWSPDGRRVAVHGGDRVVVIDVDRKTVAPIAVDERPIHGLAWSPDGRVVAFDRGDRILGVDVATKQATILARGNYPGDPAWSPDGKWIAYIDQHRGSDALFVVSTAAAGSPRLLAARASRDSPYQLGERSPQRPAWSPNSSKIAFGSGYRGMIYVVGLDGAAPRPLTRRRGDDQASNPVWSPDGRKIAFVRSQPVHTAGGARIHVIDADGRHDQPVLASDPDAVPTSPEIVWPRDLTGLPRAAPARDIVTVVPDRQLLLDAPATELAVDGDRAATISGFRVWTWSRRTGKSSSREIACDTRLYDVALAGIRDAVVCYEELNTLGYSEVSVGVNGRSVDRGISVPRWDLFAEEDDDAADLHVTGAGPLLVALRITGAPRSELWRVAPRPHVRLRTFSDLSALFNVDESRALVQARDGLLQVVSGTGAVVASLKVGALHAVLRGRRVIVLSRTTLTVRDLAGRVLLRRAVAAGSHLQDARGDLAVLARGNHLHLLRLSDGRDKTLRLPGQTGPAWARLAPQGLFYAHARTGAKAGVVGFVTAAKLRRLLAG